MPKMTDDELEAKLEEIFETRSYCTDFDMIPQWMKDEEVEIQVLLKPDDPDLKLVRDYAHWDNTMGQWTGAWRNTEGEGSFAHVEPHAWSFCTEIDEDLYADAGVTAEEVA